MGKNLEQVINELTKAQACREVEVLQSLWSGYGALSRYELRGAEWSSVIVKLVKPPTERSHPRGWNTERSHERKLQSYQVEAHWYEHYAAKCTEGARVPQCLGVVRDEDTVLMILEDLDEAGFGARPQEVGPVERAACLRWLAEFHATFLGGSSEGLWECGTYWHLATRPDEYARLASTDRALYEVAEAVDAQLNASPYQTLVHGDAKVANFCFSPEGTSVAAVDFQYVGRGCGMKDVAYFLSSCLSADECADLSEGLLDDYFYSLRRALERRGAKVDLDLLERDWRALYAYAWCDFYRFLKGWSPDHWKVHHYSECQAASVIAQLQPLG